MLAQTGIVASRRGQAFGLAPHRLVCIAVGLLRQRGQQIPAPGVRLVRAEVAVIAAERAREILALIF